MESSQDRPKENFTIPSPRLYLLLSVVSSATLTFQIILTRILSVTTYYHFAFAVVAVVMYGLTLGALAVHLFPKIFSTERTHYWIALSSLIFSISMLLSVCVHVGMPINFEPSFIALFALLVNFLSFALPFTFAGIAVSLCLTRNPGHTGKLYASDLVGAAVGCLFVFGLLNLLDALSAVVAICVLVDLAVILFCRDKGLRRIRRIAAWTACVLFAFLLINSSGSVSEQSLLRLVWVKGSREGKLLFDRWNPLSRVTVKPYVNTPFGWGIGSKYNLSDKIEQHWLEIDAGAATPITRFNGNLNCVRFLKYDITNLAHYLRHDATVLVVGVGGGRDILSALAFGQKSVVGVEMNPAIIHAVTKVFGDFSGHLEAWPGVRIVNDEARSFVERNKDNYDIIQLSLIDTFAAHSTGALALSENTLYTVEAWESFIKHLSPQGLLSVSRWYGDNFKAETLRTVGLGLRALEERGVQKPERNIALYLNENPKGSRTGGIGVATILVSPSPFDEKDYASLSQAANDIGFVQAFFPSKPGLKLFSDFIEKRQTQEIEEIVKARLDPPYDESPFFFQSARIRDLLSGNLHGGTEVLFDVLLVTILLALCTIILPMRLLDPSQQLTSSRFKLVYFSSIGLGFMFLELALIQRFSMFLGHPIYGLTVVLLSLLLGTGIGSFIFHLIQRSTGDRWTAALFLLLILVISCVGIFADSNGLSSFRSSEVSTRILVASLSLIPLGCVLGFAFPLGMQGVLKTNPRVAAWMWAVNGGFSVVGAVLATFVAIFFSISASYWVGAFMYLTAFMAWKLERS